MLIMLLVMVMVMMVMMTMMLVVVVLLSQVVRLLFMHFYMLCRVMHRTCSELRGPRATPYFRGAQDLERPLSAM